MSEIINYLNCYGLFPLVTLSLVLSSTCHLHTFSRVIGVGCFFLSSCVIFLGRGINLWRHTDIAGCNHSAFSLPIVATIPMQFATSQQYPCQYNTNPYKYHIFSVSLVLTLNRY